jgi:hypothetical protein
VGGVDRVPVAQTETVSDALGDAVEERQREDVGLTLGLRDEDRVPVAHAVSDPVAHPEGERLGLPLEVPHSVGDADAEVEREPDVHAEGLVVPLEEPDADKQRDAVGETLGLLEKEGVPVPHKVAATV